MHASRRRRDGFSGVIFVASMGMAAIGCGGAAAGGVLEHSFPSKAKLDEVAHAPPPSTEKAAENVGLAVDTWNLAGPFLPAPSSTAFTGDDPLTRAVVKQLQSSKRPLVITESMQCYAREVGRFVAEHHKVPQVDLQAFIAGRCGVIPNSPSFVYWKVSNSPTPEFAAKEIEKGLAKVDGAAELGVWMGGSDKGQVVAAAYGAPKVKVGSVKVLREGGTLLRVQGRVLAPTGWLQGYASLGSLGSSKCAATPRSTAVLPDFDLQCALGREDAYAVFDLIAGAPEALLGSKVLSLVVPVGGEIPNAYTSIAVSGAQGAKDGLLGQINAVRSNLKSAPLEEIPAQSRTAGVLVPHFFSASMDGDRHKLELITLGLMAGWDVPGPIRDSHLVSFRGTRGDNAPSFLSELLFFPSTRSILLDPDARKIALATMQDGKSRAVFGLVSTYTIFESRNFAAVETGLLDELDRQRQARGKKAIERVGGPDTDKVLDPVMSKLTRGETTPTGGLKDILDTYSQRLHREFHGTVYGTMMIDGWRPKFEGPIVDLDRIAVTAKVGFFVGQGANWGQYVLYLVYMPT